MAVYTQLSQQDFTQLLGQFPLGTLVRFKGIDGGIENTNYFVTLSKDGNEAEYVLTLFEEFTMEDMPFFVELTTWLAERGIALPLRSKINMASPLRKFIIAPLCYSLNLKARMLLKLI